MRSVDVVLPASMCAIIPMLRVSSSLNTLAIIPFKTLFSVFSSLAAALGSERPLQRPLLKFDYWLLRLTTPDLHASPKATSLTERSPTALYPHLPAIVRKRLVRFRHAMHIFLLLHRSAPRIGGVNQFIRQLVDHRAARAFSRILQQPANRQRLSPERAYFHRHLIVRSTHPPGLHFQQRLQILDGLLENLQGIVIGLLGDLIHRAVKHPLRRALLAFVHHRADEFLHDVASKYRVDGLRAPADYSFTRHFVFSLLQISFPGHPPRSPQKYLFRCRPGLRTLRAVLGPALLAILHARRVQRSAHDVIAHSRQILHASATPQHDRVLLQIVPSARN